MDLLISILLSTGCPVPILVPKTGWTKDDLGQIEVTKRGCKKFYGEKSCLITFRKVGEKSFEAICENR